MKRVLGILAVCGAIVVWATVFRRPDPATEIRPRPPASLRIRLDGQRVPACPLIRVNVTPVSSHWKLAVDSAFEIRSLEGGKVISRQKKLPSTEVSATSAGIRWGKTFTPVARLEIVPGKSPAIWIGDHQYRGTVRILRQADGRLLAVNVLPLEDYVASVVNGEMPRTFPLEARKAQAIVARTYALYQRQLNRRREFDLHSDSRGQQYPGYQYRDGKGRRLAGESAADRQVAAATRGLVCRAEGRLFPGYYSAVCGGRTILGSTTFTDAKGPFASVKCNWCREAKRFRWTVRIPHPNVSRALRIHFALTKRTFAELVSVRQVGRTIAGTPPRFYVSDGHRRYTIAAADIRRILGRSQLPSPQFDIIVGRQFVEFRGRGHGHGVGLCQWGAAGQAKSGRNAFEILRYYYRGIRIGLFDKSAVAPFSRK